MVYTGGWLTLAPECWSGHTNRDLLSLSGHLLQDCKQIGVGVCGPINQPKNITMVSVH